jgi:hypothetical protein
MGSGSLGTVVVRGEALEVCELLLLKGTLCRMGEVLPWMGVLFSGTGS